MFNVLLVKEFKNLFFFIGGGDDGRGGGLLWLFLFLNRILGLFNIWVVLFIDFLVIIFLFVWIWVLLGLGRIFGWFVWFLLFIWVEVLDIIGESLLFEIDSFILLDRMRVGEVFSFFFIEYMFLWFLIDVCGLFGFEDKFKLELFLNFFCVKGEGDFLFGLWGFVFVKFLRVWLVWGGRREFCLLIKFVELFELFDLEFFVLVCEMLFVELKLRLFFVFEILNCFVVFFDKLGSVKVFGCKVFLVSLC